MSTKPTGWTQSTRGPVPLRQWESDLMKAVADDEEQDTDLRQAAIQGLYAQEMNRKRDEAMQRDMASVARTRFECRPRLSAGVMRDYGKNSTVDVTGNLHAAACAVVVVRTEHNGNRHKLIWRDGHGRKLTRGECTTLVGRMNIHPDLRCSSLLTKFAPDN